jgi:hypothetical protein
MSQSGKIITQTQMTDPRRLSVSTDNVIYLADWESGVYQSTDDGESWSLVFKSPDGGECLQVIKVIIDHSDHFWTIEWKDNYRLRVYNVNKKGDDINLTWSDVSLSTSLDTHILLDYNSYLSYDGDMNIFLSDWDNNTVHVFTVNGQYNCQLLSSTHINSPLSLTVDRKRQLLFVGQLGSVVGVFKFTYDSVNNDHVTVVK